MEDEEVGVAPGLRYKRGIDLANSTFRPVSVGMIGLCLLDLLVVAATWFVLGWTRFDEGLGPFITASVTHYHWDTSLFDVAVVLPLLRFVSMCIVYWTLRHGVNVAHCVAAIVLPLASLGVLVAKGVTMWPHMHQLAHGMQAAALAVPLVSMAFVALQLAIGVSMVRRERRLLVAATRGDAAYSLLLNEGADAYLYDSSEEAEDDEEEEGDANDAKDSLSLNADASTPKGGKKKKKKKKRQHATLGRVARLAVPELPLLMIGSFALLFSSASNLAMPALFGRIVSAISDKHSSSELRSSVIALLIVFGVGSVFTLFRGWLFTLAGERLVARLRKQVFYAITLQEIGWFDRNRTGELTNRLASDTAAVQSAATTNVSMFLRYMVQAVGAFVILFLISWKLTLVMLSVVPLIAVGAVAYGKKLKSLRKSFQDELAKSNATAEEALGNMRTVRTFAHEEATLAEYGKDVDSSLAIGRKIALAYGVFGGVVGLVSQSAIALVLWYGGTLVLRDQMSSGTLISFMLYTMTVAFAFAFLSSLFGDFMQAVGASDRLFALMDRMPKIPISGGDVLDGVKGHIELDNVSFRYPRKKDLVLKDIHLSLEPGKVVALVGKSGSGKSTIVSLIERFYDPQEGRVLLDGVDIRTLDPIFLRNQIGFVSQEPVLFACSIRKNILFGATQHVSDADLIEAARKANAYEFIERLKDGFEAEVGERGVTLSGGQKQRVAIARALVLNPKILLLDEATSALDAESEQLVHEAIDRAMAGRTVLVIAHRLSTVRNATEVCVVDDGRIVERGTHDDLLARGGIYRDLVKRQLQSGGDSDADGEDAAAVKASSPHKAHTAFDLREEDDDDVVRDA